MAEVIKETLRDHRVVWETTHDDEILLAQCKSCGYLVTELETWEHQANVLAEQLAANGYGKLPVTTTEWAIFRRTDREDLDAPDRARYTTREGAEEAIEFGYVDGPLGWLEARSREVTTYRRPE